MAGPNPIYCPIFPDEFLENARAEVRRKTASYRSVQRSQLALLVHAHPDWDQDATWPPCGPVAPTGPSLAETLGGGKLLPGG